MTTRALLFTDLVESTDLVRRLGDTEAARVWLEHDRRARDLLARYGGREIDRSDGFFMLFESAVNAARYAIDYHQGINPLGLIARVGVHVGEVLVRANTPEDVSRGAKPAEVEGIAKPLAARVMSLARGGQTLLSADARAAIAMSVIPSNWRLDSHGHYRLKGLAEPIEILELSGTDAVAHAPPADTEKAYRVVRAGDLWKPVRDVRHNLPAERDAFVGRASELRALVQRLDAGARLITVLGPGGIGKTRLIRRYGLSWLGDWSGGVCFCDLSDARTLDGIHFAVSCALGVALGRNATDQIGHAIESRGRCLIILDNFEQLISYAAATLGKWLDIAASASFVVTSREVLHLPGEELLPIEPLPLKAEAIELFAKRAQAQQPMFVLSDGNRGSIEEVVRSVDGLPLAIELAAARIRTFSPAQLVERMRDRFAVLGGVRSAATRQATLKAAIDWSWELLSASEQAALAQCSVFEGGFTMEAAESVLDLAPHGDFSVMETIQALVDKSLLRSSAHNAPARLDLDEPYFAMYLSIRDYASAKLDASGRRGAAEERHGWYFRRYGEEPALDALSQAGGVRLLRQLVLELDNLVSACLRATRRDDSDTAVGTYLAAWEVLALQGPFSVAIELAPQLLSLELSARQRADVLSIYAHALRISGQPEPSRRLLEEAIALFRQANDRRGEGAVRRRLGQLYGDKGDTDRSMTYYEESLALHREVGDMDGEGAVLGCLGVRYGERCETALARSSFEAALSLHRAVGNRRSEGFVLGNLGVLLHELGEFDESTRCLREARDIHHEVGNRVAEGNVTGNLGGQCQELGRLDEALEYLTQALAVHREVGSKPFEGVVIASIGSVLKDLGRVAESIAHLRQALAIHRQVGDRRHEAQTGFDLGGVLLDEGRVDEARHQLEAGLVCARETHSRRLEGELLGRYGVALAAQGSTSEAAEAFANAEALLRSIGERVQLAVVLCLRGKFDVTRGDVDRGRQALAAAEDLTRAIAVQPTEVQQEISALHNMLASAAVSETRARARPPGTG